MITPRLTHRLTDSLPGFAHDILAAGFENKETYRSLSTKLAALGVNVKERTIARRGLEFRIERRRREALCSLGRDGAWQPGWSLEKLTGVLETLDLGPGFQLRARRRVQKSVSKFLADPGHDTAHALEIDLFRFYLGVLVGGQRLQEG